MSKQPVQVVLELDDNFGPLMAAAAETARGFGNVRALRDATWEPHDWSEWTT